MKTKKTKSSTTTNTNIETIKRTRAFYTVLIINVGKVLEIRPVAVEKSIESIN